MTGLFVKNRQIKSVIKLGAKVYNMVSINNNFVVLYSPFYFSIAVVLFFNALIASTYFDVFKLFTLFFNNILVSVYIGCFCNEIDDKHLDS